MTASVGILTSEQMRSEKGIGSSRIRASWLTRYWPEAELFDLGRNYSAVIFQKAYWVEYAKRFCGIRILDICDPDLLHWNSPCKTMADVCDAVTTSTPQLANLISQYTETPTFCVPDRVDLEAVDNYRKVHAGRGRARIAAWYGYSMNFQSLDAAVPGLVQNDFERLIVVANGYAPYKLPLKYRGAIQVTNYAWDADSVYGHLLEADLVVNFQLGFGRWRYKSNNKTILAWAIGLPVAHFTQELEMLRSEQSRIEEANRRYVEVRHDYDVRLSVEDYRRLIRGLEGAQTAIQDGKAEVLSGASEPM